MCDNKQTPLRAMGGGINIPHIAISTEVEGGRQTVRNRKKNLVPGHASTWRVLSSNGLEEISGCVPSEESDAYSDPDSANTMHQNTWSSNRAVTRRGSPQRRPPPRKRNATPPTSISFVRRRRFSTSRSTSELDIPPSPDASVGHSPEHLQQFRSLHYPSVSEYPLAGQSKPRPAPSLRLPPCYEKSDASTPLALLWIKVLCPMAYYCLSVLGIVFDLLKPILSLLIAVVFIVAVVTFGYSVFMIHLTSSQSWVVATVSAALYPVCSVPGVSLLGLAVCGSTRSYSDMNVTSPSLELDGLAKAEVTIKNINTDTNFPLLVVGMLHSGSAIRDVQTVVNASKIPSKELLVAEFDKFIQATDDAALKLPRLQRHVESSVRFMNITNNWVKELMDRLEFDETSQIEPAWYRTPYYYLPWASTPRQRVIKRVLDAAGQIEARIKELLEMANALNDVLNTLESQLTTIHQLTVLVFTDLEDRCQQLFFELWSLLGGNRRDRRQLERQIETLHSVNIHRREIISTINVITTKLYFLMGTLEDMRQRAAAPEILAVGSTIPVTVHVNAVQLSVDMLESEIGSGVDRSSQATA